MLVLNLLVTELLVASVGVPVEVVAAAQLGWKLGKLNCIIFGFVLTVLGKTDKNILSKNDFFLFRNECYWYICVSDVVSLDCPEQQSKWRTRIKIIN